MATTSVQVLAAVLLLAGSVLRAAAQPGIYSCVDAKGRTVTADRPIAACIGREQKELNPSGSVKRTVPPALTARERALAEEKARQAQEEKARAAEERKRNHALVTRYPDQAAHDKERSAALSVADDVVATATRRLATLAAERRKLDAEMEFYLKDPSKAPARLKRQIEENVQHTSAQQRFIAAQEGEKQRINARFDEELARLRALWAQAKAQPPVAAASAAKPPNR
ncbi:MAG: DUF4124 domain-containing protein [Ramlibacter sp.]